MHLVENPFSGQNEAAPDPTVARKHTGPLCEVKMELVVKEMRDVATAAHTPPGDAHLQGRFPEANGLTESQAPQAGGYEDVAPAA